MLSLSLLEWNVNSWLILQVQDIEILPPESSDSDDSGENIIVNLIGRRPMQIELSSGSEHDDADDSGMDEGLVETQVEILGKEARKILIKLRQAVIYANQNR